MLNENVFVHHVFFWLANPDNQAEYQQLLNGIKTLATIKSVKDIHIGVPAGTNRPVIDVSYAFSLLLIFESQAMQDEYQVDSTHLKFVDDNKHLWSKVQIYDSVNA
jgi:hypothetical protein